MIANLAVLKISGFILPMTKLFDGWRVAGTPLSRKRPRGKMVRAKFVSKPFAVRRRLPKKGIKLCTTSSRRMLLSGNFFQYK